MSYDGTYGAEETCRHDHYWRSCGVCSHIGPKATDEQIKQSQRRLDHEREQAQQKEFSQQAVYDELDSAEKVAAEALWELVLHRYPGLGQPILSDTVRKRANIDSWAVGSARSVCQQAKAVVAALRTQSVSI